MPLNSKNKSAKTNGSKEAGSTIKIIFKKYNPEKVTIDGLKKFFGFIFYHVGYNIEINTGIIGKRLDKVLDKVFSTLSGMAGSAAVFFDKLTDTIMDDLGEPMERLGRAFTAISAIRKESKEDKNRNAGKEMRAYMKDGMAKHKELAKMLYSYVTPLVCCIIFITTVSLGLGREYAIQVMVDDEPIGAIKNYTVLENANKIIENKLVSTNDQSWSLNSSIKMVALNGKETVDERQLANNILATSDENIVEATGLYVDGVFMGAVQDPTLLNNALESLKAPYINGDPNRTVSFVQQVSVLDGIFFTDSVVPDEQLANMVVSEVSGEKHYTVVSGDNPWVIARKNGITLNTLYSLNPGMQGGGMWVGDVVIVGASVPFLQVKYVETSTRQVEINYTTKTERNNSMNLGTSKVSQKGEKGLNEQTVESTYIDGILQSEIVTQTVVLKEPVQEIIQQGTLWNGQVIQGGNGRLIWPTAAGRVSRGFTGQYPSHNGVDIAAPIGTHIYAADSGVVTKAKYTNVGYGVYVEIEHGGYQTLYGHCSRLLVSVGQQVTQGQVIAYMGSTGNSTGPHLHFEVKRGNYRYDPYGWF
ncbi:MAG: peptidoglycan DD-metalloendopeptidase family protein [Oscillospiraceae bacterium]|nr:peptidoglycan DD-metalloendopeptidase family protein [Oscillospiraceae bacterium]